MSFSEVYEHFVYQINHTPLLEYVAVVFGIVSVLYSRKENVLVYPTGLINTSLYTYFCFAWWGLYAEASLNFYYTVMSLYGWYVWTRKNTHSGKTALAITASNKNDWVRALVFFFFSWVALFFILKQFTRSTVPLGDSFASATAYTGMWLMTRKKLENWIWWILTNLASIPLYFYKGAPLTSFQYIVFLVLAILGYISWKRKLIHAS
ncbi:MAG TPA: nicotinamide riboside transporter PnuC [Flavitalea sp.]|nr:nicotinamide riboside transporter PnuC [Flavitalea sp.]